MLKTLTERQWWIIHREAGSATLSVGFDDLDLTLRFFQALTEGTGVRLTRDAYALLHEIRDAVMLGRLNREVHDPSTEQLVLTALRDRELSRPELPSDPSD